MVRVDVVSGDAELLEGGPLGGNVLLVGRAAGIADQGGHHNQLCNAYGSLSDNLLVLAI